MSINPDLEEITFGSLSIFGIFNAGDNYKSCLLYCACEVDASSKVRVTFSAQFIDYLATSGEKFFHLVLYV